jgi:hypothetical protein
MGAYRKLPHLRLERLALLKPRGGQTRTPNFYTSTAACHL